MEAKSYQNQQTGLSSSTFGNQNNTDAEFSNPNGSKPSAAAPDNYLSKFFPTTGKKVPLTVIYCITFWNFGICVAIFGPTLLDSACQTSSTLSAMSLLYFMQNFTSLLGCFVSGLIIKNYK